MPLDGSLTVETDVLSGALALLADGKNWIKHAYENDRGYCMIGALRAAEGLIDGGSDAEARLAQVTIRDPGRWNDAGERTFDDVRGALRAAMT